MENVRIGELARRSGVSTRSLRYYEQQGLLSPQRSPNRYRDYGDDALHVVTQITGLLRCGLSTELIRSLQPCMSAGSTVQMCDALAAELTRARDQLDTRIRHLTASRAAIDRLLRTNSPDLDRQQADQSPARLHP